MKFISVILAIVFVFGTVSPVFADDDPKNDHVFGIGATVGFPQLISGEIVVTALPNFEFGGGFGSFPINGIAQSLYAFSPVPIDLQTGNTFQLNPSATYSISGLYGFARWFPWETGFFLQFGMATLAFSAQLNGTLVNTTLNTSVSGALAGSISLNQPMLEIGPGYQVRIGDHFHLDMGLGIMYLFGASSSVTIGGSLANFASLNSTAQSNYTAAQQSVVNAVNQAMTIYQQNLKLLPSLYLTVGYLF